MATMWMQLRMAADVEHCISLHTPKPHTSLNPEDLIGLACDAGGSPTLRFFVLL